jgi:hypothetical protein
MDDEVITSSSDRDYVGRLFRNLATKWPTPNFPAPLKNSASSK